MRRGAQEYLKAAAASRPAMMTEIPRQDWTDCARDPKRAHVWESRKFLAQMFDEALFQQIDVRRISICRVTLNDNGRWDDNISWEELMQVKREIGFGHWYAVEVYPPDKDIVNVANMRHLWLLAVPLDIGWKR